jgi:anti-anti-sigma factor
MAQTHMKVPTRSARRVTPGASHRFVVATERLDGGIPVVSISGEVDLATAPALERTLRDAADGQRGEVIVDLTCCSFLDSRGLTALLATRERLGHSGRSLRVVLSNPHVMKIFQITGFDQIFEIYPTLVAAVSGKGNGISGNGNGISGNGISGNGNGKR